MTPRKKPNPNLSPSNNELKGTDVESLKVSFVNHLEFSRGKDEYSATERDLFTALRSRCATGSSSAGSKPSRRTTTTT